MHESLELHGVTYKKLFPGLARPLTDLEAVRLRETLATHGILDPIHVVADSLDPDVRYVINGYQRLILAGELHFGPAQIPEQPYDGVLQDAKLLEVAVAFLTAGRQLSKDDRVQIELHLKARGLSAREIARQMGIGHATVSRDLQKVAVSNETRDPLPDDARRAEVAALERAGGNVDEISAALGISAHQVREDLTQNQMEADLADEAAKAKLWKVRDWLKDEYKGRVGPSTPVWCAKCHAKQSLGSLALQAPAAA